MRHHITHSLVLALALLMSLACGGGGGGGSSSTSSSSSPVIFQMKAGDLMPVEAGMTLTVFELGGSSFALEETTITSDFQEVEMVMSGLKTYVILVKLNGSPFLRTTVLPEQIVDAQDSGILEVGNLNAITTYLTGLLEIELNGTRQKLRKPSDTAKSVLFENFGSSVSNFSTLSYENFDNGSISEASIFRLRKNRINLLAMYFHGVRNAGSGATASQLSAIENLYVSIFDENNASSLHSALTSSALPEWSDSINNGLSDIEDLKARKVFFEGTGVLSSEELRKIFWEPVDNFGLTMKALETPDGFASGNIIATSLNGFTVTATNDQYPELWGATTTNSGQFIIEGLTSGNYTLKAEKAGVTLNPKSYQIQLSKSGEITGVNFSEIVDQGSVVVTPSTTNQVLSAGNYSSITIEGSANLNSSDILSGVSIFGVSGTATPMATDGTATAADIRSGVTAYAGGNPITGTMPDSTLSATSTSVTTGYISATTLESVDSDLKSENIVSGVEIFGVSGNATTSDNTTPIHKGEMTSGSISIRYR